MGWANDMAHMQSMVRGPSYNGLVDPLTVQKVLATLKRQE